MEGLPISSKTEKTMCGDFSDSDSNDLSDPYSTDASDPYSSDLNESGDTSYDTSDFSDSDSDDQDFPPKAGIQPLPAKDKHGKATGKRAINGVAEQGADETKVAESKDTGDCRDVTTYQASSSS